MLLKAILEIAATKLQKFFESCTLLPFKTCNFFDMYQSLNGKKQLLHELGHSGLFFCVFFDLCGIFAKLFFETRGEISWCTESYLISNFRDCLVGGFE